MCYTFARVSAMVHNAEAYLDAYLDATGVRDEKKGALTCKKVTGIDAVKWRESARSQYSPEVIEAEYYGAFHYYVLGRLSTIYVDRRKRPS